MPEFPTTIAHVTLTVSDLNHSVSWYERLFDAEMILDVTPVHLASRASAVGVRPCRTSISGSR